MAERCILTGLKEAGIVKGDVDEMVDKRVGTLFMPHGKSPFLPLFSAYAAGTMSLFLLIVEPMHVAVRVMSKEQKLVIASSFSG